MTSEQLAIILTEVAQEHFALKCKASNIFELAKLHFNELRFITN